MCDVYAQQATISGQIKNEFGKPVAGASIFLQHFADSIFIKTAITDSLGTYEITGLYAGRYIIKITAADYINAVTPFFIVTKSEKTKVSLLILKTSSKKMKEVTVRGTREKPILEVTADKTIFYVENSINATGSNAFELLQKSPGIATDRDDNISMKGKNGVRIYIDGRPAQMDGSDLATYLKSVNSADISSIEMISNPSAKYDAAGNAGIINIKLKKNNTIGLSSSVAAGLIIGTHPKTANALSLNYRNKKINLFSNYSYEWASNDNTFDLYRVQNDTLYDQRNFENKKGSSQNIKAGADFFISKKSTFGFIYTGNFSNNTLYSYSRTPSSAINTGKIERILYATNTLPADIKNQNFNGNYRYQDTTGQEINIDVDHSYYQSRKTSYQPNSYYTPYPETLIYEKNYRNNTPIDITINTQKIDYITPFAKGKLSAGAKVSHVKTGNTFLLYNVINNQDELDLNSSNVFLYKENINAGYLNYATALSKKINLQAGLRLENTVTNSVLTRFGQSSIMGDDTIKRNYTDLFPSAAFSYTMNANNTFDLNYSRRIDRPNYSDLNPFETRVDELTYIKGNAYLRPQYTNSIQLTHTFKERYITALGYSHYSRLQHLHY